MDADPIVARVREAIGRLLGSDGFLLTNDVNERSISHKLAEYLQAVFPSWNVDCEYNRDHDSVKKLRIGPRAPTAADTEARTVYPDIVVHRRGTNQNLVVIEVKKSTNSDSGSYDRRKLRLFITELNYIYGFFIEFATAQEDVGYQLEMFSPNGIQRTIVRVDE